MINVVTKEANKMYEINLAHGIRINIHTLNGCKKKLFMSSDSLNIQAKELKSNNILNAIEEVREIIMYKLLHLNEALNDYMKETNFNII